MLHALNHLLSTLAAEGQTAKIMIVVDADAESSFKARMVAADDVNAHTLLDSQGNMYLSAEGTTIEEALLALNMLEAAAQAKTKTGAS